MAYETIAMFVLVGFMALAMIMFCVSLVYSSNKNNKWMAFMALGLVFLAVTSLFAASVFNSYLSPQLSKYLVGVEYFFIFLAALFYFAYQGQRGDF